MNRQGLFFFWVAVFFNPIFLMAQQLAAGNYTSSDGNYTVSVSQEGDFITLIEPNRESVYKSAGDNYYYHTEEKYANYYLRVAGENDFYSGKNGGSEHAFSFSGAAISTDNMEEASKNCPLYDKYLKLSEEDDTEVQAWTFCGAAALANCTYNEKGASQYIDGIILTLKTILVNPEICPCTDVISQVRWNSVSGY